MSRTDRISQTWLDQELIPKLKICFKKTDCTVSYRISSPEVPLYLSQVSFLDLKFTGADKNAPEEISVVVKRSLENDIWYDTMKGYENFHNEILFYTKFAKNYDDYPRCLHTEEDQQKYSVVVTENITKHGFHLCPQRANIGTDFCLPAVHEIGKLHARAYILKEKCPEQFFEIVKDIRPCKYGKSDNIQFQFIVDRSATRGVDYLKKNGFDKTFCQKIESFLKNSFENIILESIKPKGHLATLCHGDFTLNNVFFKKSDIIQAKLIDFGMILYCSPAVDLSTFVFLSCNRITRSDKFSEVFDAYHGAIIECLKEAGVKELARFSRDQFFEDYKRHALFGYIISCYFLYCMLGFVGEPVEGKELENHTTEELAEMSYITGGDEVNKILAEMLLDLKALGCLDHILR